VKISAGDYVYIIVESRDGRRREHFFKAEKDKIYSTIAGMIRGDDLIGRNWGEILELQAGRAYLLPPTRYEIMRFLLRRAGQVIYPKDLGYIMEISGLMPGMKVVEAGVGSGFLTITLALVVGREGKVIGYDVRREAIETTRSNLEVLGLLDRVELRLGDIREGMEDEVDGAFLDMPDPWVALKAIHKNLKPGAPAIIFVPTYDQLRKIYKELVEQELYIIEEAVEILKRDVEIRREAIRPSTQMVGHTGFIVLLRKING
jgi:tRNA (adenine57-N1/adenine58-N1)-methyltransferase